MAIEEPVGFTEDGKLITGYRFTEADLADIGMANEMWWASPDGQRCLDDLTADLPRTSFTIGGYFEP